MWYKLVALVFVCSVGQMAQGQEQEQQLMLAYKKEFAFLNAQKKNLERRQQQLVAQQQASLQAAEQNLHQLQSRLLNLVAANEQLASELTLREQNKEKETDVASSLETMSLQASLALQEFGFPPLPEQVPVWEKLRTIFPLVIQLLPKLGKLHVQQMEYFLADGTKTSGEVLWLGQIAAFSKQAPHQGPLYPIGEGKFQLLADFVPGPVREFLTGASVPLVPVYLFESGKETTNLNKTKNLWQWITSGGPIAWVIVILGLVAAFFVIWRGLILRATRSKKSHLLMQVQGALAEKNFLRAMDYCQKEAGPRARILLLTLQNMHLSADRLNDLWAECLLAESKTIDRFSSTITVIAAIAPLLGLLGTVTGMIATFDIITEFGTGDPKLLSGGISEALITTELGLIVAIPSLLLGNILNSMGLRIKKELEHHALALYNFYLQQQDHTRPLLNHRSTVQENQCLI